MTGSGTSRSGTSGAATGGDGTAGGTPNGAEGLLTSEGIDEGSAASTIEQAHPGAADEDGLLGEPPRGAPVYEAQAAGPVDMESAEAREARAAAPGQQLQEGEG